MPSKLTRSRLRRSVHGSSGRDASIARPSSLHSFCFFCVPWFNIKCWSSFLTGVRICTSLCRWMSNWRWSRISVPGIQMRGKRPSTNSCRICLHLVDPFSASGHSWHGSEMHLRSTLYGRASAVSIQTTDRCRLLRSPPRQVTRLRDRSASPVACISLWSSVLPVSVLSMATC